MAMDPDLFWHTMGGAIGGGALITAALTLARLLLEYSMRRGERRLDHEERRRAQQRDAEARLERILQDRLAEADRRLERCDDELRAERVRSAAFENELVRLRQAHELLKLEYAALLQAESAQRLPR